MAGRVMTVTKGATRTFLEPDGLGSVRSQINSAGSEAKHFTYWPYGEVRTSTSSNIEATPFQFCGTWGYYADPLGQSLPLYVRARYYRQDLGRWQTVDPLWPSEMAYGYTYSNPVFWIDPTGLQAIFPLYPQRGKKPLPPKPTRPKLWEPTFPKQMPLKPLKPLPWHNVAPPHRLPYDPGNSAISSSFYYGAYCGSDNQRNPAWNVLPQDSLDACCLIHDRCLEAHYGSGFDQTDGHICCDQDLIDCAYNAILGCQESEDPASCLKAISLLRAGMAAALAFYAAGKPGAEPPPNCLPANQYGKWSKWDWGSPCSLRPYLPPARLPHANPFHHGVL